MKIYSAFKFFCIASHANNECISWIYCNLSYNFFDHGLCRVKWHYVKIYVTSIIIHSLSIWLCKLSVFILTLYAVRWKSTAFQFSQGYLSIRVWVQTDSIALSIYLKPEERCLEGWTSINFPCLWEDYVTDAYMTSIYTWRACCLLTELGIKSEGFFKWALTSQLYEIPDNYHVTDISIF